jgi:hypothetical protein
MSNRHIRSSLHWLTVPLCAAFAAAVPARGAVLTAYPDEAALRAALGPADVMVQENFDDFPPGTPLAIQVPGVRFSSPNAALPGYVPIQAFKTPAAMSPENILYGGFAEGQPVQQVIVLEFPAPATAVAFQFTGQFPVATDVLIRFDFKDGSSTTSTIVDVDGNNRPAEFFGVTSDSPILRLTLSSGDEAGGLFSEYGGIDDLLIALQDVNPPTCTGRPVYVEGVLGINGTGRDDRIGDTGIASIALAPGSANLSLVVDPDFTSGDPTASFRVTQSSVELDAEGSVLVGDGAGGTCSLCVNFKYVPEGPTYAEVLCCADGIVFQVSNPAMTPSGTAVCSASDFSDLEPAPPAGYEPSPGSDPWPCRILTIESPIAGLTDMVYKKDGTFDPRLRLLYSRSPDDGVTFPPFTDVTESVEEIATVIPDPTRLGGKTQWSVVKVACAIQAEVCNGLDDDGDAQVDEGLPVADHSIDFDQDGYFQCPPVGLAADCNDQIAAINPAAGERCNGMDDDCDGGIDEGNPEGGTACPLSELEGVCATGATVCENSLLVCTQTVFPSAETCNGLDDDCDGATDEDFADLGGACSAGVGACAAGGTIVCNGAGNGTTCSATPGTPAMEVACDGADNDCDGAVDEAYVFNGYLDPVNNDGTSIFKSSSTIPLKFQLQTCSGQSVAATATPTLEVLFHRDGIVGTILESVSSSGKANDGNLYRYDSKAKHYIYNLSAKSLGPEKSWIVRTRLDDGTTHDVIISVK